MSCYCWLDWGFRSGVLRLEQDEDAYRLSYLRGDSYYTRLLLDRSYINSFALTRMDRVYNDGLR